MHDPVFTFPPSTLCPSLWGSSASAAAISSTGRRSCSSSRARDKRVDLATGVWGIWMPGFMQFVTGVYLFVGLAWFHTFTVPPLYMAALARRTFTTTTSRQRGRASLTAQAPALSDPQRCRQRGG